MSQVVVCAEHSLTRAGLVAIATTAHSTVVGQVGTLTELEPWLRVFELPADLALVECPTVTAAVCHTLKQLLEQWPALSVLLLVDEEEELEGLVLQQLRQLLSLGKVSLLPLTAMGEQLRTAIATIAAGLTVFHPDLTDLVFSPPGLGDSLSFSRPPEPLSQRELEVLNELVGGASNKVIAQTLGISDHTVKFHISAILAKLSANSRTEAITIALRAGLILL